MATLAAPSSVWHHGELTLQRSVGAEEVLASVGPRFIRRFMPEQHRAFFAQLPFVVLGAVDNVGRPWATLRAGTPGFLTAIDNVRLQLTTPPDPSDPVRLAAGDAVGLLGIQPHTRRRNRANGTVLELSETATTVRITQSFGNCPKYITPREASFNAERVPHHTIGQHSPTLDLTARALIERADTFFVASYVQHKHGPRDVDVSHRGGPPGFVTVRDNGALSIPDYAGNNFFNTLGNFVLNPVAGLLFIDFALGHALHITGSVSLELNPNSADIPRHWTVSPTEVVWRRHAIPLNWRLRAPPEGRANYAVNGSKQHKAKIG